jgi:hypothetical protein
MIHFVVLTLCSVPLLQYHQMVDLLVVNKNDGELKRVCLSCRHGRRLYVCVGCVCALVSRRKQAQHDEACR